ncbi:MAG: hypothetical protein K2Y21_05845 [Phycisphaerales bacterium]|nr:hypothetical protein [Phycisphaerales bacterium]
MAVWIFTISGWLLVLAGAFIAWRFGWRDPGKGTRRCPRCGYDMTATSGLRCSECGHEEASEKRLRRRRIRRRWIVIGAMVALVSWFPFKWPEYQRLQSLGVGPIAFVPRSALVLAWPVLIDTPLAPAAKGARRRSPTPPFVFSAVDIIQPTSLWRWQRPLLGFSIRRALLQSDSVDRFRVATRLLFAAGDLGDSTAEAYLSGFIRSPRSWGLRFRPAWLLGPMAFPAGSSSLVLPALEADPTRIGMDTDLLTWLRHDGADLSKLATAYAASATIQPVFDEVVASFAYAALTPDAARALIERSMQSPKPNLYTLCELIRQSGPAASTYLPQIQQALAALETMPFARAAGVVVELRLVTPEVRSLLAARASDRVRESRFAARLALATLDDDLDGVSAIIAECRASETTNASDRMGLIASLYEFARGECWPRAVRRDALWSIGVIQGNGHVLGDSAAAVPLLLSLGADDPETVREIEAAIQTGQTFGWQAWDWYVRRGTCPHPIIDAIREKIAESKGVIRERREKQLRSVRPTAARN